MAERLLALAAEAGSIAAARFAATELPFTVSVLGHFEVRRGGRPLELPPGLPTALVKLLATARDPVHVEQVIETFWPETDPANGRKLLRNILTRLRPAGDLVVRVEDALALAPDVEVDARRFEEGARHALALAATSPARAAVLARSAAGSYRGDLLPDDPYEEWAATARERLRLRYVELLDLLVADAEARGDVDEALRLLARRLDADPLDEEQYLRTARLLHAQGRRLAAAAALSRGSKLLTRLGLPVPPAFHELAGTLRR